MRLIMPLTAATLGLLFFIGCTGNSKDTIEASGTIEGTDINIGTEVAGRVKEIRCDEGTSVNEGDTLFVIDDAEYRIQLRYAMANEDAAEAQYRLAMEGSRSEDIKQAESNYRSAEKDLKRMQELLSTQAITQKQFDDAQTRFVNAEQTYRKLEHGLRKDEITAARARRDQATAQTDALLRKVQNCSLLAPTSGTVTLRSVEVGELVSIGSNLARITYLDRVKLMIYVNETEVGKVKLNQAAKVAIDADDSRTFDGKVVFISPTAEFTPRNVQTKEERTKLVFGVKIEIDNPDGMLKPGLPADAKIFVGSTTGK